MGRGAVPGPLQFVPKREGVISRPLPRSRAGLRSPCNVYSLDPRPLGAPGLPGPAWIAAQGDFESWRSPCGWREAFLVLVASPPA